MTDAATGDDAPDRVVLARLFADLSAALVGPYAVSDLGQRLVDGCTEVLDVWAAGLIVADPAGAQMLAASTHEAALLELVQVRSGEGPCLEAMRVDDLVVVPSLDAVAERWPRWTAGAASIGVRQAYGIPLHRDGASVGALNLFRRDASPLAPDDLAVARALADVATVGILQHRALDDAVNVTAQLQRALESRVVIEQAKGLLAERSGTTVAEAFTRLRHQARSTSRPLSEVARALVEGASLPDGTADPGALGRHDARRDEV